MNISFKSWDAFKTLNNKRSGEKPTLAQSVAENKIEKTNSELGYIKLGLLVVVATGGLALGVKGIKKLVNSETVKPIVDSIKKTFVKSDEYFVEKGELVLKSQGTSSYNRRKEFPELRKHETEKLELVAKMREKDAKSFFDINYYKDIFRLKMGIRSEYLKVLREGTDPKLRSIFDTDKILFWIDDGILIHGSDRPEKKELFNHFLNEAKKYEFDIVHVPQELINPPELKDTGFSTFIAEQFPKAKKKFHEERKYTMFVMENMDNMLKDKGMPHNGIPRANISIHTHKCGSDGVIWLSTVKDLGPIDASCVRGGRVRHKIDIDKAIELSQKEK